MAGRAGSPWPQPGKVAATPTHRAAIVRWAPMVLAILLALHVAIVLLRLPEERRLPVSNAFQLAIEAIGALLMWVAVASMPAGNDRRGWALMAAAGTSYAAGIGYLVYLDRVGQELTYPSLADVFWLAFPLLATTSFLWRSWGGPRRWLVRALDTLVTGTSLFLVAWVFWFADVVRGSSGDRVAQLVTAGYPLGDVLILTSLLAFATSLPRERLPRLWPLFVGTLVIWGTDVYYTWASIHGDYSTAGVPEVGWPLGFALVAYGAVRASHEPPVASTSFTSLDQWLPYVISLPAIVTLAYTGAVGLVSRVVILASVVWISLLLVRQLTFQTQFRKAQEALVQERIRSAEADQRARALQEVADLKGQFIRTAAHQLSTPLTPIRFLLSALRRGGSPEQEETIASLDRNVQRLNGLVRDILEATRMQAEDVPLRRGDVDLAALVREVAKAFGPAFREAGVGLDVDAPAQLVVAGDETHLHQVVVTLVDQALGRSKGGAVRVSVQAAAGHATLVVRDHGDGMDPQRLRMVFDPFSQTQNLAGEQGTGLGLYIAKAVVERHGGGLRADLADDGAGVAFTATLPLHAGG